MSSTRATRLQRLGGIMLAAGLLMTGLVYVSPAARATHGTGLVPDNTNPHCPDLDLLPDNTTGKTGDNPTGTGQTTVGPYIVSWTISTDKKSVTWTSTGGIDAVVVKGGNQGAYVYTYDEALSGGPSSPPHNLQVGGPNAGQEKEIADISHVVWCYDADPPQLIVTKVVTGDADPPSTTFNYTGSWSGSFTEVGGTTQAQTIVAGAGSVTETTLSQDQIDAGWSFVSSGCALQGQDPTTTTSNTAGFTAAAGNIIVCTFTNNWTEPEREPDPTYLKVVKRVTGDANPPDEDFGFTGSWTGSLGDGDDSGLQLIQPGDGSVTEAALTQEQIEAGWSFVSSGCALDGQDPTTTTSTQADFTAAEGDTIVCTFTNDWTEPEEEEEEGWIVVEKETVNEPDPQNLQDFDFTGDAGSFSLTAGGSHGPISVAPGFYDVTETHPLPTGWTLTGAVCTGEETENSLDGETAYFEVSDGETVICTFTNEYETRPQDSARIRILKTTDPSTSQESFAFSGAINQSLSSGDFSDVVEVTPGDYEVTENLTDEQLDEGWSLESITCDEDGSPATTSEGDVASSTVTMKVETGETVICTFHNVLDSVLDSRINRPDKDDDVLPRRTTRPEVAGRILPFTGSPTDPTPLIVVAGLMMALGGGLLLIGRRAQARVIS